jgi:hypothetical protein
MPEKYRVFIKKGMEVARYHQNMMVLEQEAFLLGKFETDFGMEIIIPDKKAFMDNAQRYYSQKKFARRWGEGMYQKFSKKTRCVIDIFFDFLTNIVFLIILIPSIQYTIWNYRVKASALRVPWTYLLLVFPIFILLIFIHNTTSIVRNIRVFLGAEIKTEEELPWL